MASAGFLDGIFRMVGFGVCCMGAMLLTLLIVWGMADVIIKKLVALPDLYRLCRLVVQRKREKKEDPDG